MVNTLKKYWPGILHIAGVLVVFLQPSVSSFAASHKDSSATILLVWGIVLHWLTSPKNADQVQALKESDPHA